ncbi:inhibitor of apoptosis-promoting Bax1-domain-containing protein [Schizophyllum fasciatum]
MSQYPQQAPPSYGSTSPTKPANDESLDPLLASSSAAGMRGAIYDQPGYGDLPDDFKYGTTVSESAPEIRQAFVRKVFTILLSQAATTIVAAGVSSSDDVMTWVLHHTWSFYAPLLLSLANLAILFVKRHSHPWNLVLLSTFTLMEAFTLGVTVAFFDKVIVLQALFITLGVFVGLTLFTLQSKYDFSGMAPFLFGGLLALVMTGLVGLFLPFSHTFSLIYAVGGCLIFSGYIVYDTYLINARLSPDEYIMGAISLYLDFVNLFLSILRLLNELQER